MFFSGSGGCSATRLGGMQSHRQLCTWPNGCRRTYANARGRSTYAHRKTKTQTETRASTETERERQTEWQHQHSSLISGHVGPLITKVPSARAAPTRADGPRCSLKAASSPCRGCVPAGPDQTSPGGPACSGTQNYPALLGVGICFFTAPRPATACGGKPTSEAGAPEATQRRRRPPRRESQKSSSATARATPRR